VIRRACVVACLALLAAGCGHTIFVPPAGPGVATDASEAWTAATASCKNADHYSAALKISGRAGSQRIWRLAIDTAVTPTQIYMGATFSGQPVFVLAGSATDATLWLRREQRAVKAPAGDIIEAILGLKMPPDRLLALLTGCATRNLQITAASTHGAIVAVQTADTRVFLERQGTVWRTRGAQAEGFTVEFLWKTSALPDKVWIESTPGRDPSAKLDVSIADPSTSDPIPASVFSAPSAAASAEPMTLDELRSAGSWRKKP
jgi:hypothetical protein